MAAGMTLPSENIKEFRSCINRYAARMKAPKPEITIDCLLEPWELSPEIPQTLSYMEPFGAENPSPVFGLFGVLLEQVSPVGGGKHLRLTAVSYTHLDVYKRQEYADSRRNISDSQ